MGKSCGAARPAANRLSYPSGSQCIDRRTWKPWLACFRPGFHPSPQEAGLAQQRLRENAVQFALVGSNP
mgnify:CR=1 FL=1